MSQKLDQYFDLIRFFSNSEIREEKRSDENFTKLYQGCHYLLDSINKLAVSFVKLLTMYSTMLFLI